MQSSVNLPQRTSGSADTIHRTTLPLMQLDYCLQIYTPRITQALLPSDILEL